MNPAAVIIINLALLFYSIGVWSERLQGRLKVWHTVFFWMGLVCDTWGTGMMLEWVGGMTFDIHGLSGLLAIILMFVHAVWATVVLVRKDENMIVKFHKFSVFVWLVWLIPYFSPMVFQVVEAATEPTVPELPSQARNVSPGCEPSGQSERGMNRT